MKKNRVLTLYYHRTNIPQLDYNLLCQDTVAGDLDVDAAASRVLKKHIRAFEELAK